MRIKQMSDGRKATWHTKTCKNEGTKMKAHSSEYIGAVLRWKYCWRLTQKKDPSPKFTSLILLCPRLILIPLFHSPLLKTESFWLAKKICYLSIPLWRDNAYYEMKKERTIELKKSSCDNFSCIEKILKLKFEFLIIRNFSNKPKKGIEPVRSRSYKTEHET